MLPSCLHRHAVARAIGCVGVVVWSMAACAPVPRPVLHEVDPELEMWSGTFAKERDIEPPQRQARAPSEACPPGLTEEEQSRARAAAWEAICTPELWTHYFVAPEHAADMHFSAPHIRYVVDFTDACLVHVRFPSGGMVGWHPTFIDVTVERGSYAVLHMGEGVAW